MCPSAEDKGLGARAQLGLRRTGIPVLGELPWGSHLCHFYATAEDILAVNEPYFRAGLEDNEFCLWVTSGEFDPRSAREALTARMPQLERYAAAGQIAFVEAEQWYVDDGRFDPTRVNEAWDESLALALERGFVGLRVNGNESWLTGDRWSSFAEYEAGLEAAIGDKPILVLCTYPLVGNTGGAVFDIAASHDFSVAVRDGRWEVLETAEHVGAKALARRMNKELERLVEERTSELRKANQELQERTTLYRFLAENMSDAVALFDLDGGIDYLSPSIERILGYRLTSPCDGTHPDDLEACLAHWAAAAAGEEVRAISRRRHADGSWRWVETTMQSVNFHEKRHVLAVCRDVTDRVHLEEQLRHAQKMEALGRLAGGVAHDFNNLLTAIFGYAELALGDLPRRSPARESLGEIKMAAERARRVTRQLLTFSRREIRHPHVVDLGDLLHGLERMLRLLVREDVTLDVEPCPGPVSVLIDPVQFEQVLVNLVSNARDATPAGGTILIECKARNFPGDAGALPAGVPPGRYAQLDIADSGAGMSPDVAAHAFEPFFTTKPVGSGTGLGLSMVFGAITQSGGFVWIDSVEGKGTRVSLILPVVEAAADSLEEPSTAPPRESLAGLRVLVVEDEDVVRHFVTAVLRRAGAETFTFATPAAVLEDADRLASAVDLIVTDVIMPGMTGTTLVEALRRKRPDLPAVFMSGYATEEESLLHLAGGAPVLEKPFTPADLVARVAEAAGVGS